MSQIIDMWGPILPVPAILAHVRDNFPEAMHNYLRIFHHLPLTADIVTQFVDNLKGGISVAEYVSKMDQAGIAKTLITGFDEKKSSGKTFMPNQLIAEVYQQAPSRLIAFAGADIFRGMAAVREVVHFVEKEGFKGLSLRPFMIGLPPDDRRYYPFYAKCVELNIPVSVHASANWTLERPSDLAHPRHFDNVAADFPELKLILSHAGYPWVLEATLLARKHQHVYLELAAHRPKYLTQPGTGWESLFTFGNNVIADRVLFGTGAFLLGRPLTQLVQEFQALPVRPAVMEKWLYQNAANLWD
jgi:uncharacterized protein